MCEQQAHHSATGDLAAAQGHRRGEDLAILLEVADRNAHALGRLPDPDLVRPRPAQTQQRIHRLVTRAFLRRLARTARAS